MRPLRRLGKRGWLVMGEPELQSKALLAVLVYFSTNQSINHQREGGEKQNKALTEVLKISAITQSTYTTSTLRISFHIPIPGQRSSHGLGVKLNLVRSKYRIINPKPFVAFSVPCPVEQTFPKCWTTHRESFSHD